MKREFVHSERGFALLRYTVRIVLLLSAAFILAAVDVRANVAGRGTPAGTSVPDAGTQEQELANITFPAPYTVFEFPGTCGACHGGSIDQQAAHFGNWAGTAMASAGRDPVFRASTLIVNEAVLNATGKDGAATYCYRCHDVNAWYSGKIDPNLGGASDGSAMLTSTLLSTDGEGVQCEFCHRAVGNVTMKRADLNPLAPVWKMLSGIDDWPHKGGVYGDGPAAGMPMGNGTMQLNDAMSYGARYPGTIIESFSDLPTAGGYTGQTYGIYPSFWTGIKYPVPPRMPQFNPAGQEIAYSAGGSTVITFETAITPGDWYTAISPEHMTFGNEFIRSSEFCATCHEMTIPFMNHGMPVQRTYSEWRFSNYGRPASPAFQRCQDCHMPTMMHEFTDSDRVSLNPDPTVIGWYPYSKDRNINGGTVFHKLAGANYSLLEMMKVLYPEVDLELIGEPTGIDTRIFPGIQSSRDLSWDRAIRNTKIKLHEAGTIRIAQRPRYIGTAAGNGIWEVKVKVTNRSGHKLPSGLPDGRRLWIGLDVTDATGALVYESGHYRPGTAVLSNDASSASLNRALSNIIDATAENAVMIYERVTGECTGTPPLSCTPSPDPMNHVILFDNRIPPAGFTYADYQANGANFWSYNPLNYAPFEDAARYPEGQNWDLVTYRFYGPANPGAVLSARAELYSQNHSREFMDYLVSKSRTLVSKGPRPEGPPSRFALNYPQTPNYLSDVIGLAGMTDLSGLPLEDTWAGVAYAAWLKTGKGWPFRMAADDTTLTAAPAAPINLIASVVNPFAIRLDWNAVAGAEGYQIWIRYGTSNLTASWDKLAVTNAPRFLNKGLNVAKTYAYKVQAFNGKGISAPSAVATASTPTDLPLPPEILTVPGTTGNSITLAWYDGADNEIGFIIQRQAVPVLGAFVEIARVRSQTPGAGFGGNSWTDTTVQPGGTYNYRVAAYNASGPSIWNLNGPVQASAEVPPGGPVILTGAAVSSTQVDLSWSGATGTIVGYRIERSTNPVGPWAVIGVVSNGAVTTYSDRNAAAARTYYYRVIAYNFGGDSPPSNVLTVTTP